MEGRPVPGRRDGLLSRTGLFGGCTGLEMVEHWERHLDQPQPVGTQHTGLPPRDNGSRPARPARPAGSVARPGARKTGR